MLQQTTLVIKYERQTGDFAIYSYGVYLGSAGSYYEGETLHEHPEKALRDQFGLGPLAPEPSAYDLWYDAACAAVERGEALSLFNVPGMAAAVLTLNQRRKAV